MTQAIPEAQAAGSLDLGHEIVCRAHARQVDIRLLALLGRRDAALLVLRRAESRLP